MKILLLNPIDIHIAWPVKNDFAKYLFCNPGVTFPLLASIIGKKHTVFYFDGFYYQISIKEYKALIKQYDIILLTIVDSLVSLNYEITIKLIKKLYPEKTIIAGGIHANIYAKEWLQKGVDIIVKGEAEKSLSPLIEALEQKSSWQGINGLMYLENNVLKETASMSLLDNLDDSPMPDWSIVDFKLYNLLLRKKGYSAAIETSRGCINGCNFCLVNSFWKKSQRYKSIARVMDELKIFKSYGVSQFAMLDDGFANDIDRDTKLLEEILIAGLDLFWGCFLRIDTIIDHPKFVDLAAKSGLKRVVIGFEHTNAEILNRINKGLNKDIGDVRYAEAIDVLKRKNIFTTGLFIAGYPGLKKHEKLEYNKARKYCTDARAGNYKALPSTFGYNDISKKFDIEDMFYHDARLTSAKQASKEHFIFNLLATLDPVKYLLLFDFRYHFRQYFHTSLLLLFRQMLNFNFSKIKEFIVMKILKMPIKDKKQYLINNYLSEEFIDLLISK
ncbi:MAG: radical SAM protein [Candidatus Omnitrophica bacterium]|nr:radical SAM protein [Candidatus Omnitrophota bacterium]